MCFAISFGFRKQNDNKALALDDRGSVNYNRLSLVVYIYMAGSPFELVMNSYQNMPMPVFPITDPASCSGSNETDCLVINPTAEANFTAPKPIPQVSTL